MRLEHHLVGGYVRYISPHIIIIIRECIVFVIIATSTTTATVVVVKAGAQNKRGEPKSR